MQEVNTGPPCGFLLESVNMHEGSQGEKRADRLHNIPLKKLRAFWLTRGASLFCSHATNSAAYFSGTLLALMTEGMERYVPVRGGPGFSSLYNNDKLIQMVAPAELL